MDDSPINPVDDESLPSGVDAAPADSGDLGLGNVDADAPADDAAAEAVLEAPPIGAPADAADDAAAKAVLEAPPIGAPADASPIDAANDGNVVDPAIDGIAINGDEDILPDLGLAGEDVDGVSEPVDESNLLNLNGMAGGEISDDLSILDSDGNSSAGADGGFEGFGVEGFFGNLGLGWADVAEPVPTDDLVASQNQGLSLTYEADPLLIGGPAFVPHLKSSWLGEIFGDLYTLIWAAAWYPQVVSNYKDKSAIGFCYDLVVYNIYGFVLYTIYTITQYRYQQIENLEEAVDWQDIFFAVHSLAVNLIYLFQAWYYDGRPLFTHVGWFCRKYIQVTFVFLILQVGLAFAGLLDWVSVPGAMHADGTYEPNWSVVEAMGIVKAVITVIKYPSQVVFNHDRKSTKGMSVLGFTMDLFGGAAALAQNVSDSVIFNDFAFMTANIPKVIVAGSSLIWDSVLIFQGVWLYRNAQPIPVNERLSIRKPATRTARILEFFAPAPWPPLDTDLYDNESLNNSSIVIGDDSPLPGVHIGKPQLGSELPLSISTPVSSPAGLTMMEAGGFAAYDGIELPHTVIIDDGSLNDPDRVIDFKLI